MRTRLGDTGEDEGYEEIELEPVEIPVPATVPDSVPA
jgi:hypothetical protein